MIINNHTFLGAFAFSFLNSSASYLVFSSYSSVFFLALAIYSFRLLISFGKDYSISSSSYFTDASSLSSSFFLSSSPWYCYLNSLSFSSYSSSIFCILSFLALISCSFSYMSFLYSYMYLFKFSLLVSSLCL